MVPAPPAGAAMRPMMWANRLRGADAGSIRVLGIDPGSLRTGFGVLDAVGPKLTYVASGVIRTQKGEFAERLCDIFRCVQTLVAQYRPH